jgi:very-short-patch-repair endonuclease
MSGMHAGAKKFAFAVAEVFRRYPTDAEKRMWEFLRTKPGGIKFRRQHPFLIFVLDFYAHALKLAIEIDGTIHNEEELRTKDIQRQKQIEDAGLKVIRFSNNEVLLEFEKVKKQLLWLIHHSPSGDGGQEQQC